MRKKRDLDRLATELTKIPPYVVKMVTRAWIEAIQATLIRDGVVHLDLLGTLKITTRAPRQQILPKRYKKTSSPTIVEVPTKIMVHFRKAATLKKALQRHYRPQGETDD